MSDKFKYTTGLNNVGSYQVAGSPYVTASTVSQDTEQEIQFPRVTNNLTVKLDSAGGVTYDSIEVSGTFNMRSHQKPLGNSALAYSITAWVSASVPTDLAENRPLFSFGIHTANCLRESAGKWDALVLTDDGTFRRATSPNPIPTGWHFVTFLAFKSGANIKCQIYINGSLDKTSQTSYTDPATEFEFSGGGADGHFHIGPIDSAQSFFSDTIKFRDVILWDGQLTTANITTLYNSGNFLDYSTFTDLDKKLWIKDDLNGSSEPINHTGSITFSKQHYNTAQGDLVQVSSDSPFESEEGGGSGGELRVHYRSTGSLPNVANNKHYWTLSSQDEEIKMNVKTKEIFLSAVGGDCDFSLHADMTNIPAARMYQHTGSGVDE